MGSSERTEHRKADFRYVWHIAHHAVIDIMIAVMPYDIPNLASYPYAQNLDMGISQSIDRTLR
jgi:hypothetical protein